MIKGRGKVSKSPQTFSEDSARSYSGILADRSDRRHSLLGSGASFIEKKGSSIEEEPVKPDFSFLIFTQAKCEELLKMNVNEIESDLATFFQLQPVTELRDAALLDYYVGAVYWGKEQGFNAKQLGGLLTIIFELMMKIQEETCSMVDLFKDYYQKLIGVGMDEIPGDLNFFTIEQAKSITDYLHRSIFQHYKLYKYVFTSPHMEEIMCCNLSVEVPLPAKTPFPPPLDEGMLDSIYSEFYDVPLLSTLIKSSETLASDYTQVGEVTLPENAESLFAKLTPEDVKLIIQEVTSEVVQNLHANLENKLKNQETAVLAKINKMKVVAIDEPQPPQDSSKLEIN